MRIGSLPFFAKIATIILLFSGAVAVAAEIQVIGLAGMTPLMKDLGPQFERSTGHKLVTRFSSGAEGKRLIEAGEAFDLAILNPALIDEMTKQGKIAANTRTDIFRNGTGVVVRTGAPKVDIASVEAFKRVLLNAKSIAYSPGVRAASMLRRLSIALV